MLPMIAGYVAGQKSAARAARISSVADSMRGGGSDLIELEERMDRLMLVIEAMWALLKESGYTDEQLAERIKAMDVADGTADGRRTGQPTVCRSCDSKVAPGLAKCQYCGADTGYTPGPFDGI